MATAPLMVTVKVGDLEPVRAAIEQLETLKARFADSRVWVAEWAPPGGYSRMALVRAESRETAEDTLRRQYHIRDGGMALRWREVTAGEPDVLWYGCSGG